MPLVNADIPARRGGLSGLMSMFSQGSSMLQMGAKGKEAFGGLMGGGETAAAGGGGGGGGAMGLGLPAMQTYSDKVAPLGEASTASGGGTAVAPTILGPAAAAGAGFVAWSEMGRQQQKKQSERRQQGVEGSNRALTQAGFNWGQDGNKPSGQSPQGLSLSQPDQMSAIERRYTNRQTAMQDIDEARNALKDANLSTQDRRSIASKLEKARAQQIRGRV